MSPEIFDSEFFQKLQLIKLHMKLRFDQGQSGSRKSSAKGNSLEFSDTREYLLGDDIRHIDWNAYGRSGKLLVKLFLEEKEGRFHIFVDGSKSMNFGEAGKQIQALRVAGAYSYVVLSGLDRVFLTTSDEKGIVTSKGLTGRQAFDKILKQLREASFSSDFGLERLIYARAFHGKGIAVLISDFFMEQDMEGVFRYLTYQKQQIILVHILSPEEIRPDLDGTLNLVDSENDRKMKITMDSQVKKSYDKAYTEFRERLISLCKKYGARYIFAPSDKPFEKVCMRDMQNGAL